MYTGRMKPIFSPHYMGTLIQTYAQRGRKNPQICQRDGESTPERIGLKFRLAHTGARISEILALRAGDVDFDAGTVSHPDPLKRRAEHWRKVPVPPDLLHALELVHSLRSLGPRCAAKPLWPLSRATAHRRIAAIMANAGSKGRQPAPRASVMPTASPPSPPASHCRRSQLPSATSASPQPPASRYRNVWHGCGTSPASTKPQHSHKIHAIKPKGTPNNAPRFRPRHGFRPSLHAAASQRPDRQPDPDHFAGSRSLSGLTQNWREGKPSR